MDNKLADKVLKGDVGAAARLISAIEGGEAAALAELKKLEKHRGRAYVIGITGPPGAGKSTIIGQLTPVFRERNLSVGIIAADPLSLVSRGAILGDRVRMLPWCDEGVFMRSLASTGGCGGLATSTPAVVKVMDALGRDIIILETMGSGQADVDVINLADTCVLVLNPGSGDDIQMLKAGILEVADILVINKADRDGTAELKKGLEFMLDTRVSKRDGSRPPIVLTQAIYGEGISDLAAEIIKRREIQKVGKSSAVRGKR